MPPPQLRAMVYCTVCAPTPALRPHRVMICVDHMDGLTIQISAAGLTYWMVRQTEADLDRLLRRVRIAPSEQAKHETAIRTWGRETLYAHLNRRQALIFMWATKRDRRTGYDKLSGVAMAGRTFFRNSDPGQRSQITDANNWHISSKPDLPSTCT